MNASNGTVAFNITSDSSNKYVLLLALLLYGSLQVAIGGYIVDDAFIHLTFARNLATGHGFSFNPDLPTYGVTAPLWTLLLSLFSLVLNPGPVMAKTFSVIAGAFTIPAIMRLGRRLGLNGITLNLSILVWAANIWLNRWAASGMEASLAVLLLILAYDAHLGSKHKTAGLLLGLAVLTRPETAGLFLVFAIDHWMQNDIRAAIKTSVAGVLTILPWEIYAFATFGTIVPNPALIKSDAILPPLGDIILGVKRTVMILSGSNGVEVMIIILALASIIFSAGRISLNYRIVGLLTLWAIFPAFTYISRGVFVQSRYLLIGLPPLVVGGFLGIKFLTEKWNDNSRKSVLIALTALIIGQQLILLQSVVLPQVRSFQPIMDALIQVSERIRADSPPNAVIAVGDVGIVGFYSGKRVLDLEGLVSAEVIPLRLGQSLDEFILSGLFLKVGNPDLIIDKARNPKRLENKWDLKVLAIYPIPGGIYETANEDWYYTLYKFPDKSNLKDKS